LAALRPLTALALAAAALLAGCSGGETTEPAAPPPPAERTAPPPATRTAGRAPERIVRAWSRALNSGDNDAAADLFAPGARVIQGGITRVLATHADAVTWNASLPCSGRIVRIATSGSSATAEFVLGNRKTSPCDGPGQHAAAIFRVRRGKIVTWEQIPVPPPDELSA
jgi:limonene-1,2-epoxide hydrolase